MKQLLVKYYQRKIKKLEEAVARTKGWDKVPEEKEILYYQNKLARLKGEPERFQK